MKNTKRKVTVNRYKFVYRSRVSQVEWSENYETLSGKREIMASLNGKTYEVVFLNGPNPVGVISVCPLLDAEGEIGDLVRIERTGTYEEERFPSMV